MAKFDKDKSWKIASEGSNTQQIKNTPLRTFIIIVWMLVSLAIFVLGLVLIFNKNISTNTSVLALLVALAATGVIYVFAVWTKTTKRTTKILVFGAILILSGLAIYFFSNFIIQSFRIITGIIGIAIALFMFIDVIRLRKDGAPYIWSLIWGLIYLVIAGLILFSPDGTRILSIFVGLYTVFLSLNVFSEALVALFHVKPHLKENFVIPVPMAVAAFLPMAFFREINAMVREEPSEALYLQKPYHGEEPDLIVYVHTRAGFIPGFGHCDLCFNDKVYSFGDYDQATWKFQGFFADGVLAEIPPEKHIHMALNDNKKILMAYGLTLTDDLKQKVQAKLDDIMSKAYIWKPKAELAAEGQIKGDPKSFTDVGSQMYNDEDATLYKFKEGSKYKTYYAIGENCSEAVNDVIGQAGIGLLQLNGVVTPGTMLEYLDELYETEGTIVTDRRLYMLDEDGKPYLYPLDTKKPAKLGQMSM